MEVLGSFETLVSYRNIVRRRTPEDLVLYLHRREDLTSRISCMRHSIAFVSG
jgi:hypothetical protein